MSVVHWIRVWTTHRLMHEHVGKRAKMYRREESQMGGIKQAWQATRGGEKVCIEQTGITGMHFTSGYTSLGHEGDECNHTRTSPRGAQSMAKPRSRQANMDIKHRSMQANIGMHKGNDPTLLYRPMYMDVGLDHRI